MHTKILASGILVPILTMLLAACTPSTPTATPIPVTSPVSTPTPTATPTPSSQAAWVQERVQIVASFHRITPQGLEVLLNLDVRQMVGQPGFFGSFGFYDWTGVGEAKPIQVIHELGHAYWGAFPITGLPQLSWKVPSGKKLSPAMERYHQDTLTFMAQPPDAYEMLRQRLRILPELSQDNTGPLFHLPGPWLLSYLARGGGLVSVLGAPQKVPGEQIPRLRAL